MLPEPTFSFTIPSIHDDTPLDCRVYNPPHSILKPADTEPPWSPRGAIVAHPYAPLGGCYDDPVVSLAAAEISKKGFVVGTFNFRGAGASKGRTSWQAKPEIQDYISFAAFFIHYVEGFRGHHLRQGHNGITGTPLSPIPSAYDLPLVTPGTTTYGMYLILAGYSYGSLITTYLPPMTELLQRFESVSKGTAEAEIRLRAASLAAQWHKDARLRREAHEAQRGSHEKLRPSARTIAVAIGGDESEPGTRRPSHEARRSMDSVRRSVDRGRRKLFRQHSSEITEEALIVESLVAANIATPRTSYLLISPLLPPISMFATFFSHTKMMPDGEEKLYDRPTLAIYGDRDFFTSQRKLRKWAESLKEKPGSRFQFHEVAGAGHFWREDGAIKQMRTYIKEWVLDFGHGESS